MATEVDTKQCDVCGKPSEGRGGRTCELGHFLCGTCVSGGSLPEPRKYCILCDTPLT